MHFIHFIPCMKLRTVICTLLPATLCMGCGDRVNMCQLEGLEACMNDAPCFTAERTQ